MDENRYSTSQISKKERVETILQSETESEIIDVKKKDNANNPKQVLDRKKIEKKISKLPEGIRVVLEEKFKAEFVSIEKIDTSKLI